MAKQLVNPVERHIEKGVLGLAGLVLLGVVAKFLVTSPNRIKLGGEPVAPKEIDAKVWARAEVVRQQLKNQQPRAEEFIPALEQFEKQMHPFTTLGLGKPLAAVQPPGPDVPFIDPPQAPGEKARLVEVVKLEKPKVTAGRMLLDDPNAKKGAEQAADWVTVSSVFPRLAQVELQQRAYGLKWGDVLFGPVEMQRREQRSNGIWSEEDWVDVVSYSPVRLPPPPGVQLTHENKRMTVLKEDASVIEKYIDSINKPLDQLSIIRPLPPRELPPMTWKFPVVTSTRDVALQDEEYLHPTEPPTPNPSLDRYVSMGEGTLKAKEPVTAAPEAEDDMRKLLEQARKLYESAKKTKSLSDAEKAESMLIEVYNRGGAEEKSRAEKLLPEYGQLVKDLKYSTHEKPDESKDKAKGRELLPAQQVWVHDAQPGSLESGLTYQYRIRAVILNRLVGVPEKFENPQDATVFFIKGPWSDPSDPVTIEPAVQYFVARPDEGKREITVEAYQWFRGVWVDGKRKLKVGDPVDWEERVVAPDPVNPLTETWKPLVRFSPDATIADIDFDRRARERKLDSKGGVRIVPPDKTAAVVMVDDEGELQERLENLDRNDPAKAVLKARVFKPKKIAEP